MVLCSISGSKKKRALVETEERMKGTISRENNIALTRRQSLSRLRTQEAFSPPPWILSSCGYSHRSCFAPAAFTLTYTGKADRLATLIVCTPLSTLTARATHALPLYPAALASVPYGIVLVRVRQGNHREKLRKTRAGWAPRPGGTRR